MTVVWFVVCHAAGYAEYVCEAHRRRAPSNAYVFACPPGAMPCAECA